MKPAQDGYGLVFWLRFAEWCRGQTRLLTMTKTEAAAVIAERYGVSRATSFRWIAAWREAHPEAVPPRPIHPTPLQEQLADVLAQGSMTICEMVAESGRPYCSVRAAVCAMETKGKVVRRGWRCIESKHLRRAQRRQQLFHIVRGEQAL